MFFPTPLPKRCGCRCASWSGTLLLPSSCTIRMCHPHLLLVVGLPLLSLTLSVFVGKGMGCIPPWPSICKLLSALPTRHNPPNTTHQAQPQWWYCKGRTGESTCSMETILKPSASNVSGCGALGRSARQLAADATPK